MRAARPTAAGRLPVLARGIVDAAYRLLGALVVWRRMWFVLGAGSGFLIWLALVYQAARADTPAAWLPTLLFPAPLVLAGRWLLDLPPGVVFRPAPLPSAWPEPTMRCLASALFDTERGNEWRLLVRSRLRFGRDGALELASPPPLGSGPAVARAFPTRDPYRPAPAGPVADWTLIPQALDATRWRGSYASAAAYTATVGMLRVPRGAITACTPGWQYARLRRWPALRLEYRETSDLLAVAYLAFASEAQQVWAAQQLARH